MSRAPPSTPKEAVGTPAVEPGPCVPLPPKACTAHPSGSSLGGGERLPGAVGTAVDAAGEPVAARTA